MGQQTYKISRVTDRQIAAALSELSREFGALTVSIQAFDAQVANVTYPDGNEPAWTILLDQGSELISHFSVQFSGFQGFSIVYYRGGQNQPTLRSPVLDDLVISASPSTEAHIKLAARAYALFHPVRLPPSESSEELVIAQRAIQEATFNRLQLLQEEMVRQTLQVRKELDEQAQQRDDRFDAAFKARQDELELAATARKAELQREADELERRRAEIDDSDNTFARRKIRDQILSEVTNRISHFGVSAETSASRRPVAAGMYLLIGILLSLVVWTVAELWRVEGSLSGQSSTASASTLIALWVRLSVTSLGLAASLIYYIRWQNKWAEQYAQTEFELQQFQLDIHRANWVVETFLEWRKETQSAIPTELVQNLSRDLFAGLKPSPQVLHPADELASALMGSASKLSLNLGGNTLEVDKPGKSLPKTVSG